MFKKKEELPTRTEIKIKEEVPTKKEEQLVIEELPIKIEELPSRELIKTRIVLPGIVGLEELPTNEINTGTRYIFEYFEEEHRQIISELRRLNSLPSGDTESISSALENLENRGNMLLEEINSIKEVFTRSDSKILEEIGSIKNFIEQSENGIPVIEKTEASVGKILEEISSMKKAQNDFTRTFDNRLQSIAIPSYDEQKMFNEQLLEEIGSMKNILSQPDFGERNTIKILELMPQNLNSQDKLENIQNLQMEIRSDLRSRFEDVSRSTEAEIKEITSLKNAVQKSMGSVKKSVSGIQLSNKTYKSDYRAMISEIKKLNMKLARTDDVEILLRLQEARKKISRSRKLKLPLWAVEKRVLLEKTISSIEDEMLEILIVNSLRRVKMNISTLRKATGTNDKKLRAKLMQMTEEKKIKQEKQGRYILYCLHSENPLQEEAKTG